MKDCAGQLLEVGDYIIYPGLIGRSGTLLFGRIIEVLPKGKVKVLGVQQGYSGLRPRSKPSIINYPARAFRVYAESFPPSVRELIAKVGEK